VAANGAQLDDGLAQLPAALAAARTTLGQVQTLANQVRPLAATVAEGAPGFQRAANLIGPYASALSTAAKLASPTITLAGEALRHSGPALDALRKTSFADLLNPTAGLFNALAPVLNRLADGLFGATKGGGLGGVVVPGNDLLAPNVDPARAYLSAYLVISCEMFGVPQGPGCLTKLLQAYGSAPAQHGTSPPTASPRAAASSSLKPLLSYLLGR
jgi:hypothetical protein